MVSVSELIRQLEARGWTLAQELEQALLLRDPLGTLYAVRLDPERPGFVDLAEIAALPPVQEGLPLKAIDSGPTTASDERLDAEARRERGYRQLKDVGRLPASPQVALEIMRLTCTDAGPQTLADVASRDPAIAAMILEQANSAAVRPVAPINDLVRAVHHLGPKWVQGIAFKSSVVSRHRSGACTGFDYEGFWQESTARAVACSRIARWGDHRFTLEEAWAAGLLSQIGRLAFATALPVDYGKVLAAAADDPVRLVRKELEIFRLDHYELAGEMMRDWGLATFFWQAVLFQLDPGVLTDGSAAAGLGDSLRWSEIIWMIFQRRGHGIEPELREQAMHAAGVLGLPHEEFGAEFNAIRDEWEWLGSLFEVTTYDVRRWEEIEREGVPD
ncbi:MAG: HDOD domain-containing protein [Planctomycetota bacterium]